MCKWLFNNQALREFTAVSKKCCGQGLRLVCVWTLALEYCWVRFFALVWTAASLVVIFVLFFWTSYSKSGIGSGRCCAWLKHIGMIAAMFVSSVTTLWNRSTVTTQEFAWWGVTQKISQVREMSILVVRHLHGMSACLHGIMNSFSYSHNTSLC